MAITVPSAGSKKSWIPWRARKTHDSADRSKNLTESNPVSAKDVEDPVECVNQEGITLQPDSVSSSHSGAPPSDQHP